MKLTFLFFLSFIVSGCATYHFGHYKRSLPGGYDRIAIPMFKNKTEEVGIENYFTRALKFEFERSGLAQVTSKQDAQIILEGLVKSVSYTGDTPTNVDDTSGIETPLASSNPLPKGTSLYKGYTSAVVVTIIARKVSDNTVLWQSDFASSKGFSAALLGSPQYNYANPLYNQSARMMTIEKQAKDMMLEAHDRLTENF